MNLPDLEMTNSFLPSHRKEALLTSESHMPFWLQDYSCTFYQQQLIPSLQTMCRRWNKQPKNHTCKKTDIEQSRMLYACITCILSCGVWKLTMNHRFFEYSQYNEQLCWYSYLHLSCGAQDTAFWMMSGPELLLRYIPHTWHKSSVTFF